MDQVAHDLGQVLVRDLTLAGDLLGQHGAVLLDPGDGGNGSQGIFGCLAEHIGPSYGIWILVSNLLICERAIKGKPERM
ncbi:MAG: hypothetical protein AMXMBFR83_19130 [Phycisphaerae bacterium]